MISKTTAKSTLRIRFTVAYDGTDFCGWQRQNQKWQKPSLSQTIQEALEKVLRHPVALFASGRTDAGVHAQNQVCHFDTDWSLARLQSLDLARATRRYLPSTVLIKRVWVAPSDFHATLSPVKKTYRYFVLNSKQPSVYLKRYAEWVYHPLRLDFLNACTHQLVGKHDFKSFQSVGTEVPHTVRQIYRAEWQWRRPNVAQFTVTGSGFLKQMVRNIVGTALLLERKAMPATTMQEILLAKDRRRAGAPAPAQGLFLLQVYYPLDLDNKCREL